MKWKANSHAEAGRVLGDIARYGYRVIEALDVHISAHSTKKDDVIVDVNDIVPAFQYPFEPLEEALQPEEAASG